MQQPPPKSLACIMDMDIVEALSLLARYGTIAKLDTHRSRHSDACLNMSRHSSPPFDDLVQSGPGLLILLADDAANQYPVDPCPHYAPYNYVL